MKRIVLASALGVAALIGCATNSNEPASGSNTQDAVERLVESDMRELLSKDELKVKLAAGSVTKYGEGMGVVSTAHLDVYVTFQTESGLELPSEGGVFTFKPSADWSELVGRAKGGDLTTMPRENGAAFVAHQRDRDDLCNGAAVEVRHVTIIGPDGVSHDDGVARLTVTTNFYFPKGAVTTKSVDGDKDPGSSGGSSGGGGGGDKGDKDQPKKCPAQGAGGGAGESGTQSLHPLGPVANSGLLNGGCPLIHWPGKSGCDSSCQHRLNFFGECLMTFGRQGTCTEHRYWTTVVNGRATSGGQFRHEEANCTCD